MKKNTVLWICALLMLAVGMSSCGSDDRVMGTGQTSPASADSNTDKWLTQDQAWHMYPKSLLSLIRPFRRTITPICRQVIPPGCSLLTMFPLGTGVILADMPM